MAYEKIISKEIPLEPKLFLPSFYLSCLRTQKIKDNLFGKVTHRSNHVEWAFCFLSVDFFVLNRSLFGFDIFSIVTAENKENHNRSILKFHA